MKYLRIIILLLFLCNLPGYILALYGVVTGSILSYIAFLLIVFYYFLSKKEMPVIHFVTFGSLFFLISLIINGQFSETFLITFIKYFIFIIMMSTILRDAKREEIYTALFIGCLSIIYEAVFITCSGGASKGFYLNANFAACVCIIGYALGLTINHKSLKITGQMVFTIAGLLTFSIIFLGVWLLINTIAVFGHPRNIYNPIVCAAVLALFISFGDKLHLNRLNPGGPTNLSAEKINSKPKEKTRTETWVLYYDNILENPIWGSGFGHPVKGEDIRFTIQVGLYNTFLMIMGEAGVFALLYFLWIYGYILMNGMDFFKRKPAILYIALALILYLLTSRSYFDNYLVLFISLWLYHEIYNMKAVKLPATRMIIPLSEKVKKSSEQDLSGQYHLN